MRQGNALEHSESAGRASGEVTAAGDGPGSSPGPGRATALPRACAEDLAVIAAHLAPSDRMLVRAVYERGLPLKALAVAAETRPNRLQRRLRKILARVRSPAFRVTLRERGGWAPLRRDIADAIILAGRSQRDVARELGVSIHRVRSELQHIRGMADLHRHRALRRENE